ncbi:MAG: hypothetical protein ACPGJE_00870 [Wenzhouxiangellaceae bacterium]
MVVVAWTVQGLTTVADAQSSSRTITFDNQCPFDVWVHSTGSNASNIACSPNTQNAQANCPANNLCYEKDANTSYCVAGTTPVTSFPVTSKSDITLTPSLCTSGTQVTNTSSSNWGQCTCSVDSDCPASQTCQQVVPGVKQCYWGYALPNEGRIAASDSAAVSVAVGSSRDGAIVASGKFFARLSCDDNGNCLSDNSLGAPATFMEYTFQNDNDWYDVSYINGINVPAVMVAVPEKALDYQASDPYRCMPAGGVASSIDTVLAFQKNNRIPGNGDLKPFACVNDYASRFTGSLNGFNFVNEESPATVCTKPSDCTGGAVCGLTLSAVQNEKTATTCGSRLGYWTYAQLCAANSSYANAALGVDCTVLKNRAYALCRNESGLSDPGPGRSCFNANTTTAGDTCCGYQEWTTTVRGQTKPQPMGKGDAPISGVNTTDWKNAILPAVQRIKEGCYLAYSYQYDDPFSTFTCATGGSGANLTDYQVTLCPGGDSAGIHPPAPPTCTATVPSGYTDNSFNLGIPSTVKASVKQCDTSGQCATSVRPSAGSIYEAARGGAEYEITASNGTTTQVCRFNIPETDCIHRVTTSPTCMTWSLPQDGVWAGRNISIPSF